MVTRLPQLPLLVIAILHAGPPDQPKQPLLAALPGMLVDQFPQPTESKGYEVADDCAARKGKIGDCMRREVQADAWEGATLADACARGMRKR